jgi:hypothetical protein
MQDSDLDACGAIQSLLDDFINCHGPEFSKVGPNNSVRIASSSHLLIAMASAYANQSSVNCTCYPSLYKLPEE